MWLEVKKEKKKKNREGVNCQSTNDKLIKTSVVASHVLLFFLGRYFSFSNVEALVFLTKFSYLLLYFVSLFLAVYCSSAYFLSVRPCIHK